MADTQFVYHNSKKVRAPLLSLSLFLTAVLVLLTFNVPCAHSAQVTFAWDPSPSNVAGYKLYYGTSDGVYPNSVDAHTNTTYPLDLTAPTHYVVAKAYDNSGNESAPSNQVVAHSMTASAGAGGSITPSGTNYVGQGTSKTYSITPLSGYQIAGVQVDGESVGAVSSYTFSDIAAPHSISATFAAVPVTHTITSSAGTNGSISPSGSVSVNHGASQTYTITPSSGYKVASLTVDGSAVAAATSYTFSNVTAAHTIAATFSQSNQPPVANAGPDQTVGERVQVKLIGSNSTDPENAPLTYKWTQTGGTTVSLSSSTVADPTFEAPSTGVDGTSLTFRLTVTDTEGLKSEDTCIVNVTHTNIPPTANAGPTQTVTEGVLVTLDGSKSTDPDDGIAEYSWKQLAGTAVSFSGDSMAGFSTGVSMKGSSYGGATAESQVRVNFWAPSVGTQGESLTFELTVTDQGGLKSTATCIVNVADSVPPQANAGADQVVSQGVRVTLDGSASNDPDGTIVSYQWAQTSGPAVTIARDSMDTSGARYSFTAPDLSYDGATLVFALTVIDDTGLKAVDSCSVYVNGDVDPDLTGTHNELTYSNSYLRDSFKVTNAGNAASGRSIASFYLSNDGTTPGKLIKRVRIGALAPAKSATVSLGYFAKGLAGKYLIAVVDSTDIIVESNEKNNTVPAKIPYINGETGTY